jgi:hypothetical protein
MPRVVVKRSRAELIRKVETGKAELARLSPFPSGSSSRGTQKKTTIRYRAKSTVGTGRIGHGSATHQTANL